MEAFPPVEAELLVATLTPSGDVVYRNVPWVHVFSEASDPWSMLPESDRHLVSGLVREAAAGTPVTNQLFLVPHPDRAQPVPVLLHFLPVFGPSGKASPEVLALTITGEVLTQPTSWTSSHTLRHRMETLGRMTMGIAHDFNNLLSNILGHLELLRAAWPADVPDALVHDHVRPIEQAALDGAALVRKIQQYIRQEKKTAFEPIDLPALIRDVVALTRPYWNNEPRLQGITIEMELDLQPVPPIQGSGPELRDVLVNLILNAVQAMPEGGQIRIHTRLEPERGVLVEVADTGTGIPEHLQGRIFDPLFTTKGQQGSGMGLAVSYGIVREHDGTIDVRSTPGAGTVFTLTFPPAEADLSVPGADAPRSEGRTGRILVVDDEPGLRTVLNRLLTMKGHVVQVAASGTEALERVQREPFDLVITDQGMPEMNGRELARRLRQQAPNLPILLLTGDTDPGEPDEAVSAIMPKPFRIDRLDALVRQLLSQP